MTVKKLGDVAKKAVPNGEKTSIQVLIGPDEGPHFAMRKFTIEPGGSVPYHTNTVEHEQLVLRGSGELVCNGETFVVKKDDVTLLPAGEPHSYKCLGDEPFEFLCMVPNGEDVMEIVEE
jgi:quercetin dioxygenase-like cupin family protein